MPVSENSCIILPSSELHQASVNENKCRQAVTVDVEPSAEVTGFELRNDKHVEGLAPVEMLCGTDGSCDRESNNGHLSSAFNGTRSAYTERTIHSDDTCVLAKVTDLAEIERAVTAVEKLAADKLSLYSNADSNSLKRGNIEGVEISRTGIICVPITSKNEAANDVSACISLQVGSTAVMRTWTQLKLQKIL